MATTKPGRRPARAALTLVMVAALLGLPSCAQLQQIAMAGAQQHVQRLKPEVRADGLRLTRQPSLRALGRYFCPRVITGTAGKLSCGLVLGSPPPAAELAFEFGVNVHVHNPNDIPIPALDLLISLNLFDARDTARLGSMCVSMCGRDSPTCNGTPRPGACTVNGRRIGNARDLVSALPGLIAGIVTGKTQQELRKRQILAGGDVHLDLRFKMGIQQALGVLQTVARRYVEQLLSKQQTALDIPVSARGAVYFEIPTLGTIAVDWGPLKQNWRII